MCTTDSVLMIRPANFHFNAETAVNNAFQSKTETADLQAQTLHEFNHFIKLLAGHEVRVTVFDDTVHPLTPDSIFPNNWVSFHEDGTVVVYPMFAENRRLERRTDILEALSRQYTVRQTIDLSYFEKEEKFLEGTGSMVLDRREKVAYLCRSPRSHIEPFQVFCQKLGYSPVVFHALDRQQTAIYHTNVMMCMGSRFAVLCSESIRNASERQEVTRTILRSGREIIDISYDQLNRFAGNMLQLKNKKGQDLLILSEQAFRSLQADQVRRLENYAELVYAPLTLIEKNGGGSARCMIAEIFLPPITK